MIAGVISRISGPVVLTEHMKGSKMYDVVKVGAEELNGEIIRLLDVFVTLGRPACSTLVAYTTLGFGDILLPQEWRLLGGMASANGLLNFGLLTAMLVEVLRYVRVEQIAASVEEQEVNPHVPTGFFFGDRR